MRHGRSEKDKAKDSNRHLVEGTHNGIGRGTRRCHAIKRGKVEKETDKAGEHVLEEIVPCMDTGTPQEYRDFPRDGSHRKQEQDAEYIVHKDHSEFVHFYCLRGIFHVQHVARRGKTICNHPKEAGKGHG